MKESLKKRGSCRMKFIHFADLHLDYPFRGGRDENGFRVRTNDTIKNLQLIIDTALEEDVDFILFAGDAYHTNLPRQEYKSVLHREILRFGKPVYMVYGNHDSTKRFTSKHALYEFTSLEVPNAFVFNEPSVLDRDNIRIVGIPWQYDGFDINQFELDKNKFNICLAHATVSGSQFQSGADTGEVLLGKDFVIELEDLLRFDYVALGHIHKPQVLNDSPPVIYPGSIFMDWGSTLDPQHGFILYKDGDWELVPYNMRKMYDLTFNSSDTVSINPVDSDGLYRVILQDNDSSIENLYKILGVALEASIIKKNTPAERIRLNKGTKLDNLSDSDILGVYLKTTGHSFEEVADLWEDICS